MTFAVLPQIQYDPQDFERQHKEESKELEERNLFEIDRARIIHSPAFRRLQGKAQVFVNGSGDFFRTRLTHSLETAQIGKGLAIRLGAHPDLVEAICLAHDLGHPPYGHAGEKALHKNMITYGGFEGNAQNLRIINRLSIKFPDFDGLNLTRAAYDGMLKYKKSFEPQLKKFYYTEDQPLVDWACQGGSITEQSFECQIMDWADEIAYSVHDLEDGMKVGMISSARLLNERSITKSFSDEDFQWILERVRFVEEQNGERNRKAARRMLTSQLINEFIMAAFREEVEVAEGTSVRYRYRVRVDPVQKRRSGILKSVMFSLIVQDTRVAIMENKAERIIQGLFSVFSQQSDSTGFLFPEDFRERWEAADRAGKVRVACDYIAGMTDEYAERMYARLFIPQAGTIHYL